MFMHRKRTFVAQGPGNVSQPVTCHGTAIIKALTDGSSKTQSTFVALGAKKKEEKIK